MANATPVHSKKPLSKDAQKIKDEQAEKNVPVDADKQLMTVDQPEVDQPPAFEQRPDNAPEVNEVPAAPVAPGMAGTTTLADGTILRNN